MKQLFYIAALVASGFTFAKVTVNWIDQSFIEQYATGKHIPIQWVRIAEHSNECSDNEYFDDKYGLCVIDESTITNSKVDSLN